MNPIDFVFNQVYKGAKNGGASELSSHKHATIATDIFKKNKFSGKASEHIKLYINMAIKESKTSKRK